MAADPLTPPSLKRLGLNTGLAAAGAALVFTAFVLPAEFHRDPLGVGRLTGIARLAGPKDVTASVAASGSAVQFYPGAYQSHRIDIPLADPGAGKGGDELEYKVRLRKGDSFVYAWAAEGITNPEDLYFDFHGESPPTPDIKVVEFRQTTGLTSNGVLVAPMDGVFGWYFQNRSAGRATVHLNISGFYALVPPGQKGNEAGIRPTSP